MTASDATKQPGPADYEVVIARSDQNVAVFEEERKTLLRHVQEFLHSYPTMVPFIVLVLGLAVFTVLVGGRFFAPFNMSLILQQVTIIAIVGMAQTLVILTAGIDLSVGAIMIFSSVVMGRMAVLNGVPIFLAFPIGMLVGMACGFVNGLLVTYLRLPPFIVTLGTWSIFGALNIAYSHSETIRQQEIAVEAPLLQFTGRVIKFEWLGGAVITYGTILMVLIAIVVWYVLNRTAFGRHVYATGDDPDSARLAGINTNRTLIAVYALAGQTSNLDSITAVVIGGTSLFGGRGSIVGTLIGALIVGVFRNGLALYGLDVVWQEFTVGVLIIVAVTLDQWIRRIAA